MAQKLVFTPLVVPNGGINETKHPQQIGDSEWSEATNVEPLPDGCRARRGSTESNSVALSGAIQGIADYRLSDATTSRHVVFADGKLNVNTTGTMAEEVHAAGAFATGDDVHISHAVGNDRLFFTDNAAASRKFYVYSGTDYHENEGLAPPTAVPTLAEIADGNPLPVETYFIDYYYWNDDLGIASDRKYQGVSAATVGPISAGTGVRITDLPAAVVRTGDRATHLRIEMRNSSETLFRLVKEIVITTTAVTITAADVATVNAEYEHAIPPVHKVKCMAENRQFIGNIANSPFRLMFSAIVGTTPYYESYPATNFRDFGKGDGDYITALFFIAPRTLIIGFKNSIWAIDPRSPKTSDRFNISENIGIANHNAGIVVGRTLFFVSDAERNKGLFMYQPGQELKPLLGIDDTFQGLNHSRLDNVSCTLYTPDDVRHQWWTLVSASSSNDQDKILVYDYVMDAWAIYDPVVTGGVLGSVEESGSASVYLGGADGKEYKMDVSGASDDNGTVYQSRVKLKAFDFGQQGVEKRMRFVDYIVAQQSGGSINLEIERDHGERTPILSSLTQESVSGDLVYGTGAWGTGVWGGATTQEDSSKRTSARGRGRVFAPIVNSQDNLWHVKGLSFALQNSGKR